MAGNTAGDKLTAQKNLAKDPDFYRKLGAIGGRNGNKTNNPDYAGGFAGDNARARIVGAIGGRYGRRGHKLLERTETSGTYRRLSDGEIVEIKY